MQRLKLKPRKYKQIKQILVPRIYILIYTFNSINSFYNLKKNIYFIYNKTFMHICIS